MLSRVKMHTVNLVIPNVIWEEPRRHPSRQRMDSLAACATICAAHCRRVQSLSCKYATSTPQCHMISYTLRCAVRSPPPKKIAPFRWPVRYGYTRGLSQIGSATAEHSGLPARPYLCNSDTSSLSRLLTVYSGLMAYARYIRINHSRQCCKL